MQGSLAGKLLIAMPGIGDPRFERAVVLVCLHTEHQAMGLIVNKPRPEVTLHQVLEHLGIDPAGQVGDRRVLDGGPVRPEQGYVLHSDDFDFPDATQVIAPGIRMSMTRDVLESLADQAAPKDFVLALGYAGWGEGQLEKELLGNAWLVSDCERAIVFDDACEEKWRRAVERLGIKPFQLSGAAGRA
ncbi:MAG: YqgE/AlgH family protein [Hyphomonadaceae bacterium]|nr:YqgE/AlgH family protein [Hyphomonadaceae bacterium]